MATSFRANLDAQYSAIFTTAKQQLAGASYCEQSKVCSKPTSSFQSKKMPSLSVAQKDVELKRVRTKRQVISMSSGGNESGGLTYKDAGVDIDAGSELVRRIAKMAPGIGGFGGLYPLGMRMF